ncbi:hypothetical protein CAPTEDRAFT_202226 [Capitella teleta]|uniref:Chitin-binding type-2 domain-containing protein n=1 Tax=Capitella teleta TaxID=283909 RepID=R7V0S0_CAPTE|nr:hypothetical protein CAPTEDRAFT_202226 [Capitella teleta]|eukprot:ELU12124.1 hypothetical protein CAPTEDRAFT_202226 [Capitella teleta]
MADTWNFVAVVFLLSVLNIVHTALIAKENFPVTIEVPTNIPCGTNGTPCRAEAKREIVDPCDPPQFCNDGAVMADPDHCTRFFYCDKGRWANYLCLDSKDKYDYKKGYCWDEADCYNETCSTATPGTTPEPKLPAPCWTDVNSTCNRLDRRADQSSCYHYYDCDGDKWERKSCTDLKVYDINDIKCIQPWGGFDCDTRCLAIEEEEEDGSLSAKTVAAIVGGIAGGIVLIIIAAILISYCCRNEPDEANSDYASLNASSEGSKEPNDLYVIDDAKLNGSAQEPNQKKSAVQFHLELEVAELSEPLAPNNIFYAKQPDTPFKDYSLSSRGQLPASAATALAASANPAASPVNPPESPVTLAERQEDEEVAQQIEELKKNVVSFVSMKRDNTIRMTSNELSMWDPVLLDKGSNLYDDQEV